MKRKWTKARVIFGICAALSWWGVLYPELTLTPDTYAIVDRNGAVQGTRNMVEWDFNSDLYRSILEADSSNIRFKSKLFSQVDALIEHFK